jgi:hypothetical protein
MKFQNVLVVNTPDEPVPTAAQGTTTVRDTENPARTAIQGSLCLRIPPTFHDLCGAIPSSFSVPAGHRLVIEFVSGSCANFSNFRMPFVSLATGLDGQQTIHQLVAGFEVDAEPASENYRAFYSQHTRIYADDAVELLSPYHQFFSGFRCDLGFSGHLISLD